MFTVTTTVFLAGQSVRGYCLMRIAKRIRCYLVINALAGIEKIKSLRRLTRYPFVVLVICVNLILFANITLLCLGPLGPTSGPIFIINQPSHHADAVVKQDFSDSLQGIVGTGYMDGQEPVGILRVQSGEAKRRFCS